MKPTCLLLTLVFVAGSAVAQPYGSPYRKEYEKEKNGPHGQCRADWTALTPGLDYRAITCLGDQDDVDLHVFRIDLDIFDLDTELVRGGGAAHRVAADHNSPFAINANFFESDRSPIGVIIQSGSQLQRARASGWQAVFFIDDDQTPQIVPLSEWPKLRNQAVMAVQAGPRLVINGHTNRVHQSYSARRAGVCVAKNGDLLFFVTPQERKFDMYETAAIARRAEIDGGLECQDAMLFDGGHSAQATATGDTQRVNVTGDPVPVFIYASPR